jgi:acyl carrier protein
MSEAVMAAIFRAVDSLNETLTKKIRKRTETVRVDPEGSIDSMAMVNLIVFVEDRLARTFGRQLDLMGGDPFYEKELKTLGSMGEALCRRLAALRGARISSARSSTGRARSRVLACAGTRVTHTWVAPAR